MGTITHCPPELFKWVLEAACGAARRQPPVRRPPPRPPPPPLLCRRPPLRRRLPLPASPLACTYLRGRRLALPTWAGPAGHLPRGWAARGRLLGVGASLRHRHGAWAGRVTRPSRPCGAGRPLCHPPACPCTHAPAPACVAAHPPIRAPLTRTPTPTLPKDRPHEPGGGRLCLCNPAVGGAHGCVWGLARLLGVRVAWGALTTRIPGLPHARVWGCACFNAREGVWGA
jgi:hypothetical protein